MHACVPSLSFLARGWDVTICFKSLPRGLPCKTLLEAERKSLSLKLLCSGHYITATDNKRIHPTVPTIHRRGYFLYNTVKKGTKNLMKTNKRDWKVLSKKDNNHLWKEQIWESSWCFPYKLEDLWSVPRTNVGFLFTCFSWAWWGAPVNPELDGWRQGGPWTATIA